jgi:hypothetical protein
VAGAKELAEGGGAEANATLGEEPAASGQGILDFGFWILDWFGHWDLTLQPRRGVGFGKYQVLST